MGMGAVPSSNDSYSDGGQHIIAFLQGSYTVIAECRPKNKSTIPGPAVSQIHLDGNGCMQRNPEA